MLPVGLAVLARRVLGPMEGIAEAGERLRGMYDDARQDALSDPLTGLGNHRGFQEELARQIEAARQGAYPLSLVLIDLDDLKRTNDEQGHAAGRPAAGRDGPPDRHNHAIGRSRIPDRW